MRFSALAAMVAIPVGLALIAAGACTSSSASQRGAPPVEGSPDGSAGSLTEDAGSSVAADVGRGAGTAAGEVASGVQAAGQGVADAGASAYGAARETASSAAEGAQSAASGAAGAARDATAGAREGASGAMDSGSTGGSLTDAQIAAIAHAANMGDIQKSQLAKKRTKNAKVRQFANLMIKDHTALDNQAKKLGISPEENDTSRSLEQGAQDALGKLQDLKGKEFDAAYAQNEAQSHEKVLSALDNQLIPNAQDPELKALLQKARAKVAEHLDHARTLVDSLSR